MTETPAVVTYAAEADVRTALGNLGSRLPAGFDLAAHLRMGHAEVTDRLSSVYPDGVPTFTGDGLEVVRWAEARLVAANVLDILRAHTTTDSPAAESLRASAYSTLEAGVPGFRPGATPTTPGGTAPGPALPLSSSRRTMSLFVDPYTDQGRVRYPVWQADNHTPDPATDVVAITQANYDALVLAGADDPFTVYVITDPAPTP